MNQPFALHVGGTARSRQAGQRLSHPPGARASSAALPSPSPGQPTWAVPPA